MTQIPNFNVEKASDFILNHNEQFAKLSFKRDIEGLSIDSSQFLSLQEEILVTKKMSNLIGKQFDTGAWQPPEKDVVYGPLQKSTLWTLVLLGDMGLNGSVLSNIEKAVDYLFETQYNKEAQYFLNTNPKWNKPMQCSNAAILRALLRLGFDSRVDVKAACISHFESIYNKEGKCSYKKGDFKCAWGLIKDLLFLNEWPEDWRTKEFSGCVEACQDYLLSYDLSKADYPRKGEKKNYKWFAFSYFRSYHSDYFEAVEALVRSGIKDYPVIKSALEAIGAKCIDEQTWLAEPISNWLASFEKKGKPSPWLSLRGLRINMV